MKELIALVVAGALAVFFLGLFVLHRLEPWSLALLLVVAIGAGLAVENFDNIATFEAWGLKVQAKQIQDETIREIQKEIDAQKALLAEDMRKLNEGLTNSKEVLADLQRESQFYSTVLAAQADDRRAFDQLKAWSTDKNNPFSARAEAAWSAIFKSHNAPMYTSFYVPWKAGIDPSKLSLPELETSYATAPNELKPALLQYISKRADFPLLARDQFLIDVMRSDQSLNTIEYAGRSFAEINKIQNIVPLATDYYIKWFDDNKEQIK
jgi:hypothetical protein